MDEDLSKVVKTDEESSRLSLLSLRRTFTLLVTDFILIDILLYPDLWMSRSKFAEAS